MSIRDLVSGAAFRTPATPATHQAFTNLRTAVTEGAIQDNEISGHWLIIQTPQRLEKYFTPAVSRDELQKDYPGAILIALVDDTRSPFETGKRTP